MSAAPGRTRAGRPRTRRGRTRLRRRAVSFLTLTMPPVAGRQCCLPRCHGSGPAAPLTGYRHGGGRIGRSAKDGGPASGLAAVQAGTMSRLRSRPGARPVPARRCHRRCTPSGGSGHGRVHQQVHVAHVAQARITGRPLNLNSPFEMDLLAFLPFRSILPRSVRSRSGQLRGARRWGSQTWGRSSGPETPCISCSSIRQYRS